MYKKKNSMYLQYQYAEIGNVIYWQMWKLFCYKLGRFLVRSAI